jgi:DNA-binding MarR family transcriptional regulator
MDPDETLDHYIEIGAVEVAGIDEEGEFIFKVTEKARELAPELWDAHTEHVDEVLLGLFEKGLLSVSYNEDLEAEIELTPEGKEIAKQHGLIEFEE